jgi:preprotein translocase subunit SecA
MIAHASDAAVENFRQWLATSAPVGFDKEELFAALASKEGVGVYTAKKIIDALRERFASEEKSISEVTGSDEDARNIIHSMVRSLMLRSVDNLWQSHLLEMDHLRSDVHLRAIGQKDPLIEFKHEAFRLFDSLSMRLREDMVRSLFKFHIDIVSQVERPFFASPEEEELALEAAEEPDNFEEAEEIPQLINKLSIPLGAQRNEPCPCGSGKKYKKCCGEQNSSPE